MFWLFVIMQQQSFQECLESCSQMTDCDSVVIAEHNTVSGTYTCVLVQGIVEQLGTNADSQYTVYQAVDNKRSFGKNRTSLEKGCQHPQKQQHHIQYNTFF